jgi:DNA-binding transcriptional LysR family regulator
MFQMKSVVRLSDRSSDGVRKLASFVHISESGSLSKSAAALNIAHSGLSRQIQELEDRFGGKLFYRTGRGVVLTELGKMLLPRVKQILEGLDQLEVDAHAFNATPAGSVQVGLPASVAERLAGPLFDYTKKHHPEIHIRLVEGLSGSIEELLLEERIELGIFFAKRPNLSRGDRVLCSDALYLVGPVGDQLTLADTIDFSQVPGLPLILPGPPHSLRTFVEEAFAARGKRLTVPLEVDSLSTMRTMVATQGGYTISSYDSVARDLAARRLQASRIVSPELTRNLLLAENRRQPIIRAAELIGRVIEQLVHELIRGGHWHANIPVNGS